MDAHANAFEERLAGKKVLVTGATGFIGSHLVASLVSMNARVLALGPNLGWRPIVKKFVDQGSVRFIRLAAFWNPTAIDRVKADFQGVDYVVHLAYVMPRGVSLIEKTIDDLHRNVLGTMQLVKLLPDSVVKLIFASSSMVYGSVSTIPISETSNVNPASVYACGKFATENYLKIFAKGSDVSTSILRFATVYGPYETDPRAIPNFIRSVLAGKSPVIYGDGTDVRDYVHVSDVVEATIMAMVNNDQNFDVFNIGSGQGHSTLKIAEKIVKFADKCCAPVHKQGELCTQKIVCDISHAGKRLGYTPKVALDAGLQDEISFFSNNPKLWRRL